MKNDKNRIILFISIVIWYVPIILWLLFNLIGCDLSLTFRHIHGKNGEPLNFFASILVYGFCGIIVANVFFVVTFLIGMIVNGILHRKDEKNIYHHYSHYGRGCYKTSKAEEEDFDFVGNISQKVAYIFTYSLIIICVFIE